MTSLCIQIHPHRSTNMDMDRVRSVCESLTNDRALVGKFACTDGTDGHDYVNLNFQTDHPREFWNALQRRLYRDSALGSAMRIASMAMCEGRRGWDNYMLLHHFDPLVQCDSFPGHPLAAGAAFPRTAPHGRHSGSRRRSPSAPAGRGSR